MTSAPPAGQGLRERKKQATRQALSAAAMQLAIERGLDNVLVEDIAAAADVSPRTFNNYFASKYEAICALALDRALQMGGALRARPAAEDLWTAVRGAVRGIYAAAAAAPDPRLMAGLRLVVTSPELRGEYLKAQLMMQRDLAEAIAVRAGGDPAADACFARALAAAVVAVIQAATERWLFSDPPVPLAPLVEDGLAHMAAGLRAVLPPGSAASGPRDAQRENQEPPAQPAP
jgi:AcrR family transcriptional regulator